MSEEGPNKGCIRMLELLRGSSGCITLCLIGQTPIFKLDYSPRLRPFGHSLTHFNLLVEYLAELEVNHR